MTTFAIFPALPLLPLAVAVIAAAVLGLSVQVYLLIKNKKLPPEEKLKKFDELKATGKIKPEEYEKARQMVLDTFAKK